MGIVLIAWPADHHEELVRLVKIGLSCSEIGKRLTELFGLRRSRNSIAGRISRVRKKLGDDSFRAGFAIGRIHNAPLPPELRKANKPKLENRPRYRPPRPAVTRLSQIVCCGSPVDLDGLRDGLCHWPLWQNDDPMVARRYCGNCAIEGQFYCEAHHEIYVQKARGKWVPRPGPNRKYLQFGRAA